MRFLQIAIITAILLAIVFAIVFLQKKDSQKRVDSQPDLQHTDRSSTRTATIFISVIGVAVLALCVTVVVFHMVG